MKFYVAAACGLAKLFRWGWWLCRFLEEEKGIEVANCCYAYWYSAAATMVSTDLLETVAAWQPAPASLSCDKTYCYWWIVRCWRGICFLLVALLKTYSRFCCSGFLFGLLPSRIILPKSDRLAMQFLKVAPTPPTLLLCVFDDVLLSFILTFDVEVWLANGPAYIINWLMIFYSIDLMSQITLGEYFFFAVKFSIILINIMIWII